MIGLASAPQGRRLPRLSALIETPAQCHICGHRIRYKGSGERRMTERICGTCSLCCKLTYIPELNKSIDTWCRHARPGSGGCSIYSERPAPCRSFICGWLSGAREFGDEWFPARCKMIVTRREPRYNLAERGALVTVDPASPNSWRREPYYRQLLEWAQRMVVEIRVGRRCIRLNADGSEQEAIKTQAWLEAREDHDSNPVSSN